MFVLLGYGDVITGSACCPQALMMRDASPDDTVFFFKRSNAEQKIDLDTDE